MAGPALERKIERTAEAFERPTSTASELANYIQNQFQRKGFASTAEVSMVARPQDQEVDITVEVDQETTASSARSMWSATTPSTPRTSSSGSILPGERYDPEAMNETQRNLFGLGTFSVVQIIPELGTGQQIPIRIGNKPASGRSRWAEVQRLEVRVKSVAASQRTRTSSESCFGSMWTTAGQRVRPSPAAVSRPRTSEGWWRNRTSRACRTVVGPSLR